MNNKKKKSLLTVLLPAVFLLVLSFAIHKVSAQEGQAIGDEDAVNLQQTQESAIPDPPTLPKTGKFEIKESGSIKLILKKFQLVSQEYGNLKLSFALENQDSIPYFNLKYAIRLVHPREVNPLYSMDEQVFDDTIEAINPGQLIEKEITYGAPPFFSGQYNLGLVFYNEEGVMLQIGTINGVELYGGGNYIDINNNICYLKAADDPKKYPVIQGVDVRPNEKLTLYCEMRNVGPDNYNAYPYIEIFNKSSLGEKVLDNSEAEKGIVSFEGNQQQLVSFEIPKPEKPQAYEGTLYLIENVNNTRISTQARFHFIVSGESATIKSAILENPQIKKGEEVKLNVELRGNVYNFFGSRTASREQNEQEKIYLDAFAKDGEKTCFEIEKFEADPGKIQLSGSVQDDCSSYVLTVQAKNSYGDLLDEKTYQYAKETIKGSAGEEAGKNKLAKIVLGLIIFLGVIFLAIVAIAIIKFRKRAKLMLFLIVIGASLLVHQKCRADSGVEYFTGSYTYLLDKNSAFLYSASNPTLCSYCGSPAPPGMPAPNGCCDPGVHAYNPTCLYACFSDYFTFYYRYTEAYNDNKVCTNENVTAVVDVYSDSGCANGASYTARVKKDIEPDSSWRWPVYQRWIQDNGTLGAVFTNIGSWPAVGSRNINYAFLFDHGAAEGDASDDKYYEKNQSISIQNCCSVTCATGPGCRSSLTNGTTTTGECCGSGSCYTCASGYTWNGSSCVSSNQTISGYVRRDTGTAISGVTIDLYNGNTGAHSYPTTNSSGYWSGTIPSGQHYAARISSGLPSGYSSISAINNNWCVLNGSTSYEYQLAGQNIGDCSSSDINKKWDRNTDSNLNFTVTYPSYSCTGTAPSNATLCSGDDSGLTANTARTLVASCTTLKKCEYTCNSGYTYNSSTGTCVAITYSCTGGPIPANSTKCSNDDINLTSNLPWQYTASCTSRKCEYYCNSGYTWNASTQRCEAPSYSCTGLGLPPANSTKCANDETGLTSNLAWQYVAACTTTRKCEFQCNSGYTWNASTQKCEVTTYTCGGSIGANATACSGDNTGLTSPNNWHGVASCTLATKCEYTCNPGYTWDGSSCAAAVTVSGHVESNKGANIYNAAINACGSNVNTDWYGDWTTNAFSIGSTYCARISSVPTSGYTSISALNNTSCHSGQSSYEWQIAGQNSYVGCSYTTDQRSWDRNTDSGFDFTVNYPFQCTGSTPTNATLCTGDDTGLTADTSRTVVAACGAPKCEYTCNSGYVKSGNSCVAATPTLNFYADSTSLAYSGSTNLHWTTTNSVGCYSTGDWPNINRAASGDYATGNLTANKTYNLECWNSLGTSTGIKTVTVNVAAAPAATVTLSASPNPVANQGDSTTLSWNTTNAISCTASGDWSGTKSTTASTESQTIDSDKTFTLTCQNIAGASASASVPVSYTRCSGSIPPGTGITCSGNEEGSGTWHAVSSCSADKCEYTCVPPSIFSGGTCCTPDCSDAPKYCEGDGFPAKNHCGSPTQCTGTKDCGGEWHEINP